MIAPMAELLNWSAVKVAAMFPSIRKCARAIGTLLLLSGIAVGRIPARGTSRRDGDVAIAIVASCALGQFMPLFYETPFLQPAVAAFKSEAKPSQCRSYIVSVCSVAPWPPACLVTPPSFPQTFF